MDHNCRIREIPREDVGPSGALELAWRVFEEFEAPVYLPEGIREFKRFIASETVLQKMAEGKLYLWGAFDGDKIVGVIAARPPAHVALLFVDKAYHRRGIARSLYDTVVDFYERNGGCDEITVNSSPYAVEAYRRLGFAEMDTEQTIDGIRFTPMKHIRKDQGMEKAKVEIRRYEPKDEALLFGLIERAGEEWTEYCKGPGRAKYQQALAHSLCYLLFEEDQLCGYARCRDDDGYGVYVYDLLVDEKYRGKAYGRTLMERVCEDFPNDTVYVMSDVDPYYEKLGYQRVGSIFVVRG